MTAETTTKAEAFAGRLGCGEEARTPVDLCAYTLELGKRR